MHNRSGAINEKSQKLILKHFNTIIDLLTTKTKICQLPKQQ